MRIQEGSDYRPDPKSRTAQTIAWQRFMKMEETPFAKRFAMLRDKFGTSWMLLHQAHSPAEKEW